MAADLNEPPWDRLSKLAPEGTTTPDLQAAADRYEDTEDLFAACADLWEEYALTLPLPAAGDVKSESTGDVSVTRYGSGGALSAAMGRAEYFRSRANAYSFRFKEVAPARHNCAETWETGCCGDCMSYPC